MGEMRRTISQAFVRAEAICLLARMCMLGPGASAAGKRRQEAEREEEGGESPLLGSCAGERKEVAW